MLISRKLAHKAQNQLQVIMSLIEVRDAQEAIREIRKLSLLIAGHIETREEEQARAARDEGSP